MSCAKYLPLISKCLDGEASSTELADMEAHLAVCALCRAAQSDWRAQGAVLRGYFVRNALDEQFVGRVRTASEARAAGTVRQGHFGPRVFRWAQAIAALVVVGFLAVHFFPSLEPTGLAKVINPGDGLQVLSPGGASWTRTAAGAVLRAGDWIRNAERAAAQILLLDTAQVTLDMGAVAQIGSGAEPSEAQLTLVQGTVSSEETSGREFHVRAGAADIIASNARFGVHVESLTVGRLEMSDDASEVLSGATVPIAGLMVGSGKVRLQGAAGQRDVVAGETAYFTPAQIAVVPQHSAALAVVASLQPERTDTGRTGRLSGALLSTDAGLQMHVRAENVPLKRLLESTTGEQVAGAGEVRVTGDLAYPVESSDEAIVEAIGNQLGVPISVSERGADQKTASISQNRARLVSELQARSEFTVRKSPDGLLSFDFKGVPAGQVFRALQSVNVDLPQLSSEDRWMPVTLEASDMTTQEVAAWIDQQLGLVTTETGSGVRVVQLGGPDLPEVAALPVAAAPTSAPGSVAQASDKQAGGPDERAAVQPERRIRASSSSGWWPVSAASSPAPFSSVVGLPGRTTSSSADTVSGGGTSSNSTATGKISDLDRYTGSRHLIWPVLSSDGTPAVYVVSNPWATRSVETVWKGYDASGQLVAVQEMVLDPSSTVSISPAQDLPACGENGHWETFSEYLIYSFTDTALAVPAVEAENIPDKWEFDLTQLGTADRLWFANPSDAGTRVVLALMRGEEILASQEINLAPHAALTWTADPQTSGAMLVANVVEGSLAAGVLTADQTSQPRRGGGEWVH